MWRGRGQKRIGKQNHMNREKENARIGLEKYCGNERRGEERGNREWLMERRLGKKLI